MKNKTGLVLGAQCTIVYAHSDIGGLEDSAAVAKSFSCAAQDSLSVGQFHVTLRELSSEDVRRNIETMPAGHDRLMQNSTMILLGTGAMLAYAPYRARVLLSGDPFADIESICRSIGIDEDFARIRLHDALLSAERVMTLGRPAFDAVASLLPNRPETKTYPSRALTASESATAPILIVNNGDPQFAQEVRSLLDDALLEDEFIGFDAARVFDQAWKVVVHLGFATSDVAGARLGDAWAGGVPVLQLLDRSNRDAQRRRQRGSLAEIVVEHGKTGLLVASPEELARALNDFIVDPLPARVVARNARRRVEPTAEWDVFLTEVLQ